MLPRLCIVIVNWNSWQLLEQCLNALARQTWQDFRVIVVDNASSQPAPEAFLERHANVEIRYSEYNRGFAAANNWAIQTAQDAEWIALLNPDALPEPDWLAQLMDAVHDTLTAHVSAAAN